MKSRSLLSALPLALAASPAPAQAPAPAAPPESPSAAAPEPEPEPEPAPAAPAPAAPAPASAPVVEAPALPPSDKVTVAKTGYFQPGLNLQAWAFASHLDDGTDETWSSTFRIRRAEIKARGEIIEKKLGYLVMFDVARLLDFRRTGVDVSDTGSPPATIGTASVLEPPSGGSTSILQDLQLTYMTDYADISIGQFKIPVSLEGSGSAARLYFPERALVSRQFGDKRDLGVKVEKTLGAFGYTFGVYNGEGQNRLDSNDQKDVSLRLEVYPVRGVTAAVVGYVAAFDRDDPGTKDRLEGDLKVELGGVLVQAEYIRAWDMGADGTRVSGHGFYALAGYTFFDRLQPVVRVGALDPAIGQDENGALEIDRADEYMTYELGVNYYAKSHDAKLQLAGGFFDPEQRVASTRFDLTLAAQIAF